MLGKIIRVDMFIVFIQKITLDSSSIDKVRDLSLNAVQALEKEDYYQNCECQIFLEWSRVTKNNTSG